MCGLVGLVNKNINGFTKNQQEAFSTLLYLDHLRGNDSTGVFAVHGDGDVFVAKEASIAADFLQTEAYAEVMKRTWKNGNALIGHNRKATRGVVNDANAHPFVVDDKIILVHNGTMYGDHKKMADVEVDSHAIAHVIHEKGDVTEALSSFDAAYALIWFNVEKKTLNFVRNTARPLYFMETHDSVMWASEKCMLEFVKSRLNLYSKDGPIELTADTLTTFTLNNNKWDSDSTKLAIKKVYTYTPPSSNSKVVHYPRQQQNIPHRRHPYANGYMNEPWDDIDTEVHGAREEPANAGNKSPNNVFPTFDHESTRAKKQGKTVTSGEFFHKISTEYLEDEEIIAITFDYDYANQHDSSGGYYLYSYVVDNPDVVIRHFIESKYATEERILVMSSSEYVYKYVIGRKRWTAYDPKNSQGLNTPGYVILEAKRATLISGGGVTNPAHMEAVQ